MTSRVPEVCAELGLEIDADLRELSVTHRSWAYENGQAPTNERLEFLGDSVLGLVVTEHLYAVHPDLPEGQLAKLRSAVVNSRALADVARGLQLGEEIKLGRGEVATGGADKSSILADTMEATIGAVFLSSGIDGARRFVHRLFDPVMEEATALGAGLDWKTSLQEAGARQGLGHPEYVITESGPDHDKRFQARVRFGDELFDEGVGHSKKEAEQAAAASAFAALEARAG